MKSRAIKLLILLSLATLSLTACGKQSEPVNETAIVEETTEEEATEEATAEETTEEETTEEETTEKEEPTEAEPSGTTSNNPYADYSKNDESLEGYEVTITETLDTKLYVVKEYDYRRLDNEKAGKTSPAEIGAYVTVTGKTSNGWYEVQSGYMKVYVPEDVLSTENPLPPVDMDKVNPETGKTTQENLDAFYEAMQDPALDEIIGPGSHIPETGTVTDMYTPEDNVW